MKTVKTTAAQFVRLLPALQHLALFPKADHVKICQARACPIEEVHAVMRDLAHDVRRWDEDALNLAARRFRTPLPTFKPLPKAAPPAAVTRATPPHSPQPAREAVPAKLRATAPAVIPAPVPVKLTATTSPGAWLEAQGLRSVEPIVSYIVSVTPAIAASWLKFNVGNRTPARTKVRRFIATMQAGKWTLNGETVKFSVTGRLLDGQSRLMAIVESRVTVALEIRFGLPDLAQESMDCGELRKGWHTLEMQGEGYPGILAAALKLAYFHECGWLAGVPFGASRVLENSALKNLLARHTGLRASVGWMVGPGHKSRTLMPASEATFLHYLCGLADPKLRDTFFEALVDGVGLTKASPVYHLRERLLEHRHSRAMAQSDRLGLVFKAWNLARAGTPCTHLVYRATGPSAEKFPTLAGLPASHGKAAA